MKTSTPTSAVEDYSIPLKVLSDRNISVLEAISEYLHDEKNLSYHEIAVLMKRDDRTIWTCYHRAKKKRENGRTAK